MIDDQTRPESLEGYFIISEVELMDPNFFRTVVLIVTHNEDGAFGLVVTRRSEATLGDLVTGVEDTPAAGIPIYVGGPVQQEFLFVLHAGLPEGVTSEHASMPADGVVFEPVTEQFVTYLVTEWSVMEESDRPRVHLYAGYSGWGAGQLENEIEEGAWVHHKASADIVFHPNPAEGWRHALRKKGGLYQIVAETGFKPSMN